MVLTFSSIYFKVLNNPPTEREHKPGKFPKHNKAMVQLKKKMNGVYYFHFYFAFIG